MFDWVKNDKNKKRREGVPQLAMGILAAIVGVIAGLGAVVFRYMINFVHNLFFLGTFSFHYNTNLHTAASPWGAFIILVPVIGALGVVWLVKTFAPEAKGHGVPEVMDAIYLKRGRIRPIVAIIKSIASALSIGSGGSVGREGPIVQIGSAFGSILGQIAKIPTWQRGILIAAGASGGIAATFNTPIGGLAFGVELMLASVSAITLFPVAIATVIATYVGCLFFGTQPSFYIHALVSHPAFHLINPEELALFVPFGLLLGLVAVVFVRGVYWMEDRFEGLFKNYYVRHMVGMLIMGVMMYLIMRYTGHYYVQGVGYATVMDVLKGILLHPWFLLLLCAAKLISTFLTLGSGASGGIFSPSLFIGATFGGAFGCLMQFLFPGLHVSVTIFAIAGMAGMIGGATGAVITAVTMIPEMTHNLDAILPIITTVGITYIVRKSISNANIYTLKLLRRGAVVPEGLQAAMPLAQHAEHVMSKNFKIVDKKDLLKKKAYFNNKNWKNEPLIVADKEKILGIWRYPLVQDENADKEIDVYMDKNFVLVEPQTTIPEVLRRAREKMSRYALVTSSEYDTLAKDVQGIISKYEIIQSNIQASYLLH